MYVRKRTSIVDESFAIKERWTTMVSRLVQYFCENLFEVGCPTL